MSAVDFSNPRYFGQATISVDSKGRIFIPTKWHDQIGESVILHIGLSRMGRGKCVLPCREKEGGPQLRRAPVGDCGA